MTTTRAGRLAAAALLAALAGCGAGPYPVEGVVVWEDDAPAKELANGSVVFDLPEKQISARGVIGPDGTFRLTTVKPGDGAMAGEYKVLVVEGGRRPLGGADASQMAPGHMDAKYADPRTTDLTATVGRGTNQVKLKVKRAAKK